MMKLVLKIFGISLLTTIVSIIGSGFLPFSDSFREANQTSNPFSIVFFQLVYIWFTITVYYIGKNSNWKKKWLIVSLLFVYATVYSFMTQIETLFFKNAFGALSEQDVRMIILSNIIPFFVIVPLSLKMGSNNLPKINPKIEINLTAAIRNIGILGGVYMLIYFLFGYFVAWQFADLREFYSGTNEKLPFIKHMIVASQNSNIVPFQFLRGVLFSAFILPVVFMFLHKGKQLLISLILIFLSTGIVLIIPNVLFPDIVRWAHFIEMISSMAVFAVATYLVWNKHSKILYLSQSNYQYEE